MASLGTYLGWKVDFRTPRGEPAFCAPDSVAWRVYKNPIALGVGGVCAVLLEFADARIRSGVWDHSTFPQDPIGRSERTGIAALVSVYGPQSAARHVIAGVNRMHERVTGTTPSGEPYRALDPELLAWVGATAGYGFLTAYDRFVEPLDAEERRRFFAEGKEIAASIPGMWCSASGGISWAASRAAVSALRLCPVIMAAKDKNWRLCMLYIK